MADPPSDPSRQRRVTAADVAAQAGVSRSAVSRAFTAGSYLDDAKRARILETAEELGYRPNALAAGLKGGQSNIVAIFAGRLSNEYDREVVTRLVEALNAQGRWPIMIAGHGPQAHEALVNVLRYPLETMILRSGSLEQDVVEACTKLHIPVISSGRVIAAPGVDSVCVRNAEGMAQSTELLIARGRRRFAYIGGPSRFGASQARRDGMAKALDAAGLSVVAEAEGGFSYEGGYAAAQQLGEAQFDALLCANDAMALGALAALRAQGRKVPQDVALIGFDDIAMAAWPGFELTTQCNPVAGLVQTVTDLIHRRADDPARAEEQIWLDTDLILRKTHGA